MEKIKGSLEWESLLARAKAALDDQGLEAYRKRVAAMDRKWARLERDTGMKKPPYDLYLSREVMVDYDANNRFKAAVDRVGAKENAVIESIAWDADLWVVRDFIKNRLHDRMKFKAADIAMDAQDELGKVVTGKSKTNPKGLALALERTAPELYGDPDKHTSESAARSAVTYNLPNLTLNLISTPKGMALEAKSEDAIDVEAY